MHISIKSSTFAAFLYNTNMQVTKVIKKYGYTIEEVAQKIGYVYSASLRVCLSNKGGKPANPTLSTLRSIADAIGCSVGEFFDDERTPIVQNGWGGVQPKLNIQRVMSQQGITRKELATRLDVSVQQVATLIGKQNMSLQSAFKIASALSVPITELFSYD